MTYCSPMLFSDFPPVEPLGVFSVVSLPVEGGSCSWLLLEGRMLQAFSVS